MELKISVEKRHVYFIGILIVVFGGILIVQGQGINNYGHDAESVYVNVNGVEKGLQERIDNKELVYVNVGGSEKSLQEAIDDGDIGQKLSCRTKKKTCAGKECTVNCGTDEFVVGGGCGIGCTSASGCGRGGHRDEPTSDAKGWYCFDSDSWDDETIVSAVCCSWV